MANILLPTLSSTLSTPVEPEYYPDTRTFVNLLGIQSSKELLKFEAGLTDVRSIELLQQPDIVEQTFDSLHLKRIHHHLFQDVFEWAGRFRSYDFRKSGDEFTPAADIEIWADDVFGEIATDNYLIDLTDKGVIAAKAARYLGRINALHPFPEGNGRAQRIFISHLMGNTPYNVHWDKVYRPWEMKVVCQNVHRLPESERFESMASMLFRIMVER